MPKISTALSSLASVNPRVSSMLKDDHIWGITPPQVIKKLPVDNVTYTPANGSAATRVCVGFACYEFMGLVGKKALFYDLNVSASKKTFTLSRGEILSKPLRVKRVTTDTVTLVDTKRYTTYEMSLFKIDISPYIPKADPKKGKK